ncbi:isoprenoid biosynthesis glyoxalase ElbB [Candidatus Sodalis sp. SoCistrobi]|uniref:isoprenoid biosynthesis glyoxalase ElbB n=1 Tax=Candidatus Sodalis sp. SoCistrobi TaxID=1922216 RepID=UPI00093A96D9|nr:isoprenoid biosynthesis glyoxalase ElbB [Candidatus Sodalis sp. SoCistrobi]
MKRIGIVLSGCGVNDGSEIQEAVLTLLAIDRAGADAVCFAPDKPQLQVVNHLSGEQTDERRNVLVEAARIARGQIQPLSAANADDLDGLIVPGGYGVAKNLSNLAQTGADCEVDAELARLVQALHLQRKPLGFICIAPALLPKILAVPLRLTLGTDVDAAEMVDAMGAIHVTCPVDDIVIDGDNNIITTPAYMQETSIAEVAKGIDKLVARVLEYIP